MINPQPLCPGHPTHPCSPRTGPSTTSWAGEGQAPGTYPGLGVCISTWHQGWGACWPSAAHLGLPGATLLTPSSAPPTLAWEAWLTVTHSPSLCQLGLVPRSRAEGPGSSCLLGEHCQQLQLPRALRRQGSFPRTLKSTPADTGTRGL